MSSTSGDDVIDDAIDDVTDGGGDWRKIFETDAFEKSVVGVLVGWIVKNVFLDPAAITLGLLESLASTLIGSFESTVRGSLGTAGSSIYAAFLGPEGWVTAIQQALIGVATSAGAGSALAAGLVNLLLLVAVVGGLYLVARVVAGYLSGGVLS